MFFGWKRQQFIEHIATCCFTNLSSYSSSRPWFHNSFRSRHWNTHPKRKSIFEIKLTASLSRLDVTAEMHTILVPSVIAFDSWIVAFFPSFFLRKKRWMSIRWHTIGHAWKRSHTFFQFGKALTVKKCFCFSYNPKSNYLCPKKSLLAALCLLFWIVAYDVSIVSPYSSAVLTAVCHFSQIWSTA